MRNKRNTLDEFGEYLTVPEVVEYLALFKIKRAKSTIYRRIEAGKIPTVSVLGERFVPRRSIDNGLARITRSTPADI
ncbi:helix-turn-helix domain-containing protein [Saccharomonospora azurea]|uniref:helix-turn-helix transcriptional regulator n=1 Tax=Saccharomonospora azurea TaxID=40988 RepID=UPI00333080A3